MVSADDCISRFLLIVLSAPSSNSRTTLICLCKVPRSARTANVRTQTAAQGRLNNGKSLATELKKNAKRLGKELEFDEAQTGASEMAVCTTVTKNICRSTSHVDNEYSRAGISDPKIVITTSRDPSSKLLQFSKVCKPYTLQRQCSCQELGNTAGIPEFSPNQSRKLCCQGTS